MTSRVKILRSGLDGWIILNKLILGWKMLVADLCCICCLCKGRYANAALSSMYMTLAM
jgi:hypothetical protein